MDLAELVREEFLLPGVRWDDAVLRACRTATRAGVIAWLDAMGHRVPKSWNLHQLASAVRDVLALRPDAWEVVTGWQLVPGDFISADEDALITLDRVRAGEPDADMDDMLWGRVAEDGYLVREIRASFGSQSEYREVVTDGDVMVVYMFGRVLRMVK